MARFYFFQPFLAFLILECYASDCFFPNGDVAVDDLPCDSGAGVSACCAGKSGVVCLENNLCQETSGHLSRGSCTDKDWNSGACARRCLDTGNNGVGMRSCAAQTGDDTSFCCWKAAQSCCEDGMGRFNVLPHNPDVWARYNESSNEFVVVGTRYNSDTSTSPIPSSTSTSSTFSSIADSSATEEPTTATTSLAPTSPAPTNDSTSEGLSTGAKAGIGVGAGVGGIMAVITVLLLWRRHNNNNKKHGGRPKFQDVAEIQSTPIQELPGYKFTAPPAPPPVELPNNERT